MNKHTACRNPVWNAETIIAYWFETFEISRYFAETETEIEYLLRAQTPFCGAGFLHLFSTSLPSYCARVGTGRFRVRIGRNNPFFLDAAYGTPHKP
jgi:hypothetical protein